MKKLGIGAVTALLIVAAPAMAQTADRDALAAMAKCASVTDVNQRLACYAAAAPAAKSVLVTTPPVLTRAPTKEEESSWFGFNLPSLFGDNGSTQTTPQQ